MVVGMTIVEFLRARYDEDEATAREAQPGPWRFHREGQELQILAADGDLVTEWTYGVRPWVPADWDEADMRAPNHIARHDPARVLREVEAKRRIVDMAADYSPELEHGDNGEWALNETLHFLADVYCDHPDYDPTWSAA